MLRKNILANFGGQTATSVISLLVVPFYIHYLGEEAFGLISFFLSFQAILAVLDLGLSTTANREVGTLNITQQDRRDGRNLLRTLELFYLAMGALIGAAVFLSSGWISRHWIESQQIAPDTVQNCVRLFAITVALRWPTALYQGIIRGLEKHLELNYLTTFLALVRGLGGVLVLMFVTRSINGFLVWQLLAGVLETLLSGWMAWKGFGGSWAGPARFQRAIFQRVWRFAFNLGWVSIFGVAIKQLDKIIISNLLPIAQLGYYNTASVAGMSLSRFFQPIQSAAFPRFTRLFAAGKMEELASTLHQTAQAVSFLLAPVSSIVIFFSYEILLFWTRSEQFALNGATPLSLFGMAMLLNSMMAIPYVLQLACGMTWLPLYTNAISLVVLAPLTYFLVRTYGIAGGGVAWLVFNLSYYFIVPHLIFRQVLRDHKRAWILKDTLPYLVGSSALFALMRFLADCVGGRLAQLSFVILGLMVYGVITLSVSGTIRAFLSSISPAPLALLLRNWQNPKQKTYD